MDEGCEKEENKVIHLPKARKYAKKISRAKVVEKDSLKSNSLKPDANV
jgi:hypothetical protein